MKYDAGVTYSAIFVPTYAPSSSARTQPSCTSAGMIGYITSYKPTAGSLFAWSVMASSLIGPAWASI